MEQSASRDPIPFAERDEVDSSANSESDAEASVSKGSTSTSNITTKDAQEKELELAKTETVMVNRLRLLVLTILFMAAATVSVIVYFITIGIENQQFETQFSAAADALVDAFLGISTSRLGAVASLGVAMIAHGVDHRYRWPFVTVVSTKSDLEYRFLPICFST